MHDYNKATSVAEETIRVRLQRQLSADRTPQTNHDTQSATIYIYLKKSLAESYVRCLNLMLDSSYVRLYIFG